MEYPDCCREKKRKARKEHRCCECGGTIKKKETYQYISGIWDGDPGSFKTCLKCAELRTIAFSKERYWEDGPPLGELSLWIEEWEDCAGEKFNG